MLHMLFDAGGVVFWAIICTAVVLEIIYIGNEKYLASFFNPVLLAVILMLFSSFNIFTFMYSNWVVCLKFAAMYVAAGVLWSMFKWYLCCAKRAATVKRLKYEWLARHNLVDTQAVSSLTFQERVSYFEHIIRGVGGITLLSHDFDRNPHESDSAYSGRISSLFTQKIFLLPSENKGRITAWMSAWPFSLLWWVLGDLMTEFWNIIRRATRFVFMKVSIFAFRGVLKDVV